MHGVLLQQRAQSSQEPWQFVFRSDVPGPALVEPPDADVVSVHVGHRCSRNGWNSYKPSAVPTVGQHHLFGHRIGADRKLAHWAKTPRQCRPRVPDSCPDRGRFPQGRLVPCE